MENSTEAQLQNNGSNTAVNQQSIQAEISPAVLQQRFDELTYAATLNPAIKESPEYKEAEKGLKELADKISKPAPQKQAKAPVTPAAGENEEEEGDEEENEEEESKNPFLAKKPQAKTPDKIENIEEYMKKRYATDDPAKFFTSVDKWRNDSQEKAKVQEELEGILSDLEKAPEPIKAALLAHANGQNWEEALGSYVGRPDFNKAFDNNDSEHLVKFYFKNEYKSLQEQVTKGDLDEEDFEKQVKLLKSAVKPLFEKDKGEFNNKRASHMKAAEEFDKNFRASVNGSVEAFKTDFPGFKPSDLQKIKQALVSGNVNSLFMDKNGMYRKDAAKKIAFVLYGDTLYSDAVEKAENRGQSKANEVIVARGQKEMPNSKSNQAAQNQVEQNAVAHLNFATKKKDYL